MVDNGRKGKLVKRSMLVAKTLAVRTVQWKSFAQRLILDYIKHLDAMQIYHKLSFLMMVLVVVLLLCLIISMILCCCNYAVSGGIISLI